MSLLPEKFSFKELLKHLETKLGKTLLGLTLSILVCLFTIFLYQYVPFFSRIEMLLLNLRNEVRYARGEGIQHSEGVTIQSKKIGKSEDLFIIKMDERSFVKHGQMPWKRSAYALPLQKFEKGQYTVTFNWINKEEDQTRPLWYRIYYCPQPITNSESLANATLAATVQSSEEQTYLDLQFFESGRYYFAVTSMNEQGIENRTVEAGENSFLAPINIRIKPALKAKLGPIEETYREERQESEAAYPEKTAARKDKLYISNFDVYLNYPKGIFYDVFFLDYKNRKHDQILFDTLKKSANVFVDYFVRLDKRTQTPYPDFKERIKAMQRFAMPAKRNFPGRSSLYAHSAELPIPPIISNVRGVGSASASQGKDEVTRTFKLVYQFATNHYPQKFYPSAPLLLAMHYFNVPASDVHINLGEHIVLSNAEIPVKDRLGNTIATRTKHIRIPVDDKGDMFINFLGKASDKVFIDDADEEYYISSFSRFPDYSAQPGNMRNNIYLVGLYEDAIESSDVVSDIWPTPMGRMFGIEILANTLNTIVTRNFLTTIPDFINLLAVFVLGALLGVFLTRMSILRGSILFLGLILFVASISYFVLFENNLINNMVQPLLAFTLVFISITIHKTVVEESEKRFIRNQFGKFVNKEVVDELLRDPSKFRLGGERRKITVLFSDIRSFTTLSEGMDAESLVAFLNEYLSAMTSIVLQYRGTLDKYVGDEIMAFWGAPLPESEHAYLACITAVDMMDKLNDLNKNWPADKQLDIGIGLNSGDMLAGNMGSESRMDYTIIGDNVNLGARLEGTNKYYKTNIIISEFTYEQVRERVVVRELDLVRVKGKHKPVRIYELLDVIR